MQGRLSSLEKVSVSTTSSSTFTSSASSKEVVTAELSSDQEGDRVRDHHGSRRLQAEDEFSSIHEGSDTRSKRHRSTSSIVKRNWMRIPRTDNFLPQYDLC